MSGRQPEGWGVQLPGTAWLQSSVFMMSAFIYFYPHQTDSGRAGLCPWGPHKRLTGLSTVFRWYYPFKNSLCYESHCSQNAMIWYFFNFLTCLQLGVAHDMHPDKEELICEPFKDENKTQPVNPKKEVQPILADIIKWSFNNFPFLWAHGHPL